MPKRLIPTLVLIAYSALLIKLLILKDVSFRIGHLMFDFTGHATGPANLVPFKTILPYLLGEKGQVIAAFNLFGNIVLLIPLGFIIPFIFPNLTWKKSLIVAIVVPFVIEITQVMLRVRIFDIDDVILNGLGVMIGYWMFVGFKKIMRSA